VSEEGDEAPTLCLKREYSPLMRPLTKSLGPGARGLLERLCSKSLNEVRVTEREAVVWMWSSSFCKASLSTVGSLTDDSEARLEAGDEGMRAVVGMAVGSTGGRKFCVHCLLSRTGWLEEEVEVECMVLRGVQVGGWC
jgi:hypothetical protein